MISLDKMNDARNDEVLVVFSPSGKRGWFPRFTPVLTAARSIGVDIDSVCGGRAICGRCQIQVSEGAFAKHNIQSRAGNLSHPGEAETKFRRLRGLSDDCRLSCQATLRADVVIDVPASSQVHHQVIRKPDEDHDIEINPVVHLYFADVTQPDMLFPSSDMRRLTDTLERDWQINDLNCELFVIQNLQSCLRAGNWQVTVAVRNDTQLIAIWPGFKERVYGVAVDVGSTTIAAHLCDLTSGHVLTSAGLMNPQIRFGEDLMSRISYIMMNSGGEEDLIRTVRKAINDLVTKVCHQAEIEPQDVVEMTLVGNPIMQHLVLGINPVELGKAPFALALDTGIHLLAADIDLNINPGGYVYALPCIAGHVGADAAGVLLAEAPWAYEAVSLIIDVGTNAEIIIGNRNRLLAASSPTGPAFEGAQISSGQRAARGAIERVRIDPETLESKFKVIGCKSWSDEAEFSKHIASGDITGICGSGIVEAIAEMYLAGIIDQDGTISGAYSSRSPRIVKDGRTFAFVLHDGKPEIRILQADVRAVQLAKAALYAGVQLLMERFGIARVARIRLAGAFGTHIDVKYAMVLGLIPDCDLDQVSSAGNAAGTGARIALLDRTARAQIESRVRQVEKIETAVAAQFQNQFVAAMSIPHQIHKFDELAKRLTLPKRKKTPTMGARNRRRKDSID